MKIKPYLNKIYSVIGVILTLAAFYGLYLAVDSYVAKAEDVKNLSIEFHSYLISQQARDIQRRLWEIEDRYGKNPATMPPQWRNEYRSLQLDLAKEKKKLKDLEKK